MNAEQKKQAAVLLQQHSDDVMPHHVLLADMAALLQELMDAPTPKPFGYFKAEPFGWTDCAETDDGAIALFAAPPAPSVPDGWKHDCAGIMQNDVELWLDSCPHCGKPKTDAAPTPAEAPADVARDAERYRWLRTHGLQRAWVSLGTDFEGDNFASFRCEFNLPEPPNLPYEDDEGLPWADKDFDAAIDAAIEREILGGEHD